MSQMFCVVALSRLLCRPIQMDGDHTVLPMYTSGGRTFSDTVTNIAGHQHTIRHGSDDHRLSICHISVASFNTRGHHCRSDDSVYTSKCYILCLNKVDAT